MTGTEPLWLSPAINALMGLIARTLGEMGNKDIDSPFKQLIYNATKEYINKYRRRHGQLNILGMSQPVLLDEIYTSVLILDTKSLEGYESIETLEEIYRTQQDFRRQDLERRPGINVANKEQFLTVLGAPGSGKSTFLRRIGLEALKGNTSNYEHHKIPVLIELKRFDSTEIRVEKQIHEEFRTCGFPNPESFAKHALRKGKLLILLDGLDEVPNRNLTYVIREIEDFVSHYDNNRFVVSCRTAAYNNFLKSFRSISIADFDDNQIEQFIFNWFQSKLDQESHTAQKCFTLLFHPENSAAKELAQTPLLLTFLCLVYGRSQSFPNNRSTLYGKALNILLEEWISENRIERDPIYKGLYADLEKELLAKIAYDNFKDGQLFFHKNSIKRQVSDFLADTLDVSKQLNSDAVLRAIEVQQGILVKRAEDIYSFSHLTLQEYLVAFYISQSDRKLFKSIAYDNIKDRAWREVFLLITGLMGQETNELLLFMARQPQQDMLINSQLFELIRWAERSINNSERIYKRIAQIAAAICLRIASGSANSRNKINVSGNTIASAETRARVSVRDTARTLASAIDYSIDECIENLINHVAVSGSLIYTSKRILSNKGAIGALEGAITSLRVVKEASILQEIPLSNAISKLKSLSQKSFKVDKSVKTYSNFIKNVERIWLSGFQLTPEMTKLTLDNYREIDDYLYMNKLVFDCKDSAVRVSKKAWEDIEQSMLNSKAE
ncbi:MAG: NACHT domain-containing protein [Bacteroidota bacterium]